MNLLFFDIECAGVHKTYAKICVFGYVLCDERFNIIKKEDILINPRGRFELTDRKGEKGIVLPYEYAEFKHHPTFTQVYPHIKELLEDPENFVFGHAVLNDVKYLNLETKRFHLPSFRFSFADSQLIFMTHINDYSRQFGLEYIASALGVEFTPHRAADDAYATMRIVEAICKAREVEVKDLLNDLNISLGKIERYGVTRPVSRGFKKFNAAKNAARRERGIKRTKFFNHLSRKKPSKKVGALSGRMITFSRPVEDDILISIPLVDKIYASGGRYSQKIDLCNLYVAAADDKTARTQAAASLGIETITPERLKEILNA